MRSLGPDSPSRGGKHAVSVEARSAARCSSANTLGGWPTCCAVSAPLIHRHEGGQWSHEVKPVGKHVAPVRRSMCGALTVVLRTVNKHGVAVLLGVAAVRARRKVTQ
jgi:hypothetical protein